MSVVLNPFTGNFDEVSDLTTTVGSSPNSNASTVVQAGTAIALTLQPADGSNPGVISTASQTIAGAKTLTSALTMSSNQIHSVADPSSAQDAATKAYVDAAVSALNPATAVYAASTANIAGTYSNGVAGVGATFTTTATGTFTIDGVTPPISARILIKDQSSGFQNGIYNITTLGTIGVSTIFTRALDYNTASDMNSAGLIPVINGTTNALSSWQQTATITTVGTDSLVFQEFTANPSLYLLKANNLSDVANKTTSFNNLSPMTTQGDIIYGGASGTGTRLAKGTQYQTLQGGSSTPGYDAVHLDQATAITGALPIGNGGTGQITKAAAFDALQPMTTGGDIIYGGASGTGTRLANGSSGQVLTSAGSTSAPTWQTPTTGTVTSVAASGPSGIATWSAAVTTSGTLTQTLSNQNANLFLAGPASGSAATPTFRALTIPAMRTIGSPSGTLSASPNVVKYGNTPTVNDGGGSYSTSTGLYTVAVAGYFQVSAGVRLTIGGAAQYMALYIYINGSGLIGSFLNSTGTVSNQGITVNGMVKCAANDTIGIYVQTNGSTPSYLDSSVDSGPVVMNYFSILGAPQ